MRKMMNVSIRLDAMTTIPLTVPVHELPILKHVHRGNVTEGELIDADGDSPDAGAEYGRLCGKYSASVVEKVFGLPESGNLEKAMKPAKRQKPEATGEQEGG